MSTSKAQSDDERFIILLRHGIAGERSPAVKDEDRALTEEGHRRMKQIARGITLLMPKVQAIVSSPLLRAMQTAEHVVEAYDSRVAVSSSDALRPGADATDLRALLASIDARRVILVGHEPNLTDNVRALARLGRSARLDLKKGGCCGLRLDDDGAVLEWMLPPRVLRKL